VSYRAVPSQQLSDSEPKLMSSLDCYILYKPPCVSCDVVSINVYYSRFDHFLRGVCYFTVMIMILVMIIFTLALFDCHMLYL
jgi:hypothetical protein